VKKDYLEDLKDELEESPVLKSEIHQILRQYDALYDDYMDEGFTPSKVEEKLGTPQEIVSEILAARKVEKSGIDPTVYFSFFLSIIIYLIVGYFTELWHPTWLILLLSPAVYIFKKR
jgi:hypothetical protein